MKKIIIPISTLFATSIAYAQTNTENYIQTRTYLEAVTSSNSTAKQIQAVEYLDALGRTKQIVNVKATPLGKDVATPIVYDQFGIQTRDYLPVPQSGMQSGSIYTQNTGQVDFPINDVTGIYTGEKTYSEKVLDNSPLNRILQQKSVGNNWTGKSINFNYELNTASDKVKKYVTVTTWINNTTRIAISVGEFYENAKLYKDTVTDEDGNTSIEFKNSEGQTVLVRKNDGVQDIDTYYVYNEYNQQAFVIPPLASAALKNLASGTSVSDTILDNLCYQYQYDNENRLVEKKLPGKGWEYILYDQQDRQVGYQDANLKAQNKWLCTKYDKFGRVVYTCILTYGESRIFFQNILDTEVNNPSNNEERSSTGFTKSGIQIYYTTAAFPALGDNDPILTVNYYDTYPTGTPTIPSQVLGQDVLSQDAQNSAVSTKSLPVSSYVKNIEDDNWTKNYIWYDKKGRAIGTYSYNHLGGYTKTESLLDFAGVSTLSKTYHKRLDTDTEKVITETFTYDSQNRLLVHKHKVDNYAEEILAQNTYNELSQLSNKKVGGITSSTPLQDINYAYNIRGSMTKVNDPKNLGNKLFGYEIKYNQVEGLETPNTDFSTLKVKPKYNGNIAEVDWRTNTVTGDNLRRYGYVYDGLNRLLAGFYQKDTNPSAREYFEKIDYDLNGNITNLKRSGALLGTAEADIDILDYAYTGNQLTSVTDSSTDYRGYPDTSGSKIHYDGNGNMIDHADKGILTITYNYLNLPDYIKFSEFVGTRFKQYANTTNIYRADGVKLNKLYMYKDPNASATLSSLETDYLDGFQYEASNGGSPILKFVPTAEGYYNFENNKYIYQYKDHLGNVRLSYFNNGTSAEVLEENNYYPFGMKHEGYNPTAGNPAYNYGYNGKELQKETGWSDYGARMYMSDIGRWGVVDPLAEKMTRYSPYNYAFNNPIRFIDPDGRDGAEFDQFINSWAAGVNSANSSSQKKSPTDDHFNKNGRYMYTDNKKTNNIIVHTSQRNVRLSQLDYSSKGTARAVSNILAYYGGQKNISGYIGIANMNSKTIGGYTNDRGNIFFNVNRLIRGTYDNAYNVRSTLNHEGGLLGHKNENIPSNRYTYVDHSKVYLNEALNPDFAKTTDSYKAGQASSFVNHVLNADVKESTYGVNHLDMLNQYNENKAGVEVGIYTGGGLTTGASIDVSVNGQKYKTGHYEDIKKPQD